MRWLLVQAAWSARRARRKDALQLWAEQLEQRRGSTYRAEEAAAASS